MADRDVKMRKMLNWKDRDGKKNWSIYVRIIVYYGKFIMLNTKKYTEKNRIFI